MLLYMTEISKSRNKISRNLFTKPTVAISNSFAQNALKNVGLSRRWRLSHHFLSLL